MIDFCSKQMRYRIKQASLRKEMLARAMGRKPSEQPSIVDATAGLGRDSFILAALGFTITMLERSPVLYTELQSALVHAQEDTQLAPIVARLTLIQTDAIEWLPLHADYDIIYLDPMFPPRKKSASVKKEMVTLHNLLGSDSDSAQLLELALACAKQRVVVKRPRLAANLADRAPSFTLQGKSSRFDVYLT